MVSKYEEEITNLILSNPYDIKLLGPEDYKEHLRTLINELVHKYF